MEKPNKIHKGVLWSRLNRWTAWVYTIIVHSFVGRVMLGYRKADRALRKDDVGRYSCKPVSSARLRMAEAMENSRMLAALRWLFRCLLACPARAYGLFGLIYGLFGVVFHLLLSSSLSYLIMLGVIAVASIPLLATSNSMGSVLVGSWGIRVILVHLLGIPRDRLDIPKNPKLKGLPLVGILLGVLGAGAALIVHPLVVPLIFPCLWFVGVLFADPEAGVVLSTLLLPAIWLNRQFLLLTSVVVLLTLISYGAKLLCLHRTFRSGLLDRVILILGLLMLVCGLTEAAGAMATTETRMSVLYLLVCLGDYFLIVNLMSSRAYIRRCLIGVGISVVLVTFLSYLHLIPVDSLSWMKASPAGKVIVTFAEECYAHLSELWVEHSELYLVLVFPWLYAYLVHAKRLVRKMAWLALIALDVMLVVTSGSVSAQFCVLGVTVLFFLLLDHKWFSVGIAALPLGLCGVWWITYLYPLPDALRTILSRSRHYKAQLRESLWQMVLDHPAGIGIGEEAFAQVYPAYAAPDLEAVTDSGSLFFEILLSYGWVGLLLFGAVLFLFLQKSMTCLRYTAAAKDRAMILGGAVSLIGAVVFGSVRSFITSPRVFFTILLVVALCSAYENVVFDEYDTQDAEWRGSVQAENRVYRKA